MCVLRSPLLLDNGGPNAADRYSKPHEFISLLLIGWLFFGFLFLTPKKIPLITVSFYFFQPCSLGDSGLSSIVLSLGKFRDGVSAHQT